MRTLLTLRTLSVITFVPAFLLFGLFLDYLDIQVPYESNFLLILMVGFSCLYIGIPILLERLTVNSSHSSREIESGVGAASIAERHASRSRRITTQLAWIGGSLIVIVGYGVTIPMKRWGCLSSNITWIRVFVGPPVLAAIIVLPIQIARRFPNRPFLLAFMPLVLVTIAWMIVHALEAAP